MRECVRHGQPLSPGQLRAGARGADRDRPAGDRGRSRRTSTVATCASVPTRSATRASSTTGSSATGWCTACASSTARRSGTATATCAPTRSRASWGSPTRARTGTAATSPRTPTCSSTPAGRWPWSRPGRPPYELTEELDTVGPTDFDGTLRMGTLPAGYTAHPHEDPETGELHAVSYNWLRGNRVDYTVRGTDGRIRRTVPVAGRRQPDDARLRADRELRRALRPAGGLRQATVLARDAAGGAGPGPADDVGDHRPQPAARPGDRPDRPRSAGRSDLATLPYSWDPDYPARLGLLPREGGSDDVRWFDIDPCFVFHTLNAYEDGDTVVVDVVRHDRMFATVLNGPDEGPADAGALHHRPARRQGPGGPLRRPLPGVPAHRRAVHRAAAPVRLLGRLPGRPARRRRAPARPGGRLDPGRATSGRAARPASSASSSTRARPTRPTAC